MINLSTKNIKEGVKILTLKNGIKISGKVIDFNADDTINNHICLRLSTSSSTFYADLNKENGFYYFNLEPIFLLDEKEINKSKDFINCLKLAENIPSTNWEGNNFNLYLSFVKNKMPISVQKDLLLLFEKIPNHKWQNILSIIDIIKPKKNTFKHLNEFLEKIFET